VVLNAASDAQVHTELYERFDTLLHKRGLEKLDSLGEQYLACAGLRAPATPDEAMQLLEVGLEMKAFTRRYAARKNVDISLRVGLHCGDATGGVSTVPAAELQRSRQQPLYRL